MQLFMSTTIKNNPLSGLSNIHCTVSAKRSCDTSTNEMTIQQSIKEQSARCYGDMGPRHTAGEPKFQLDARQSRGKGRNFSRGANATLLPVSTYYNEGILMSSIKQKSNGFPLPIHKTSPLTRSRNTYIKTSPLTGSRNTHIINSIRMRCVPTQSPDP